MTISSSLNAGVAGLNANATRLATIADNIANSGTYGYKRAAADFSNMVITNARGSGVYSAGGVRASSFRLIEERGALVGTSNALDLAVSGRGMLPVMPEVSLGNALRRDAADDDHDRRFSHRFEWGAEDRLGPGPAGLAGGVGWYYSDFSARYDRRIATDRHQLQPDRK